MAAGPQLLEIIKRLHARTVVVGSASFPHCREGLGLMTEHPASSPCVALLVAASGTAAPAGAILRGAWSISVTNPVGDQT